MRPSIRKIKNIKRHVKGALARTGSRSSSEITFKFDEGNLVTPSRKVQAYECATGLPISIKPGDVCMVTNPDASLKYIRLMCNGRIIRVNPRVLRFLEDNP